MPYYGDGGPYYYGNPFANHSSLMTGTGRPFHAPLTRYSPHLSTISESPLSNLRRYSPVTITRRPRRTIDTADIDVSTPRTLTHEDSRQRHHLRRDRQTIKIRSQALKDNPALREIYEKHEKNVGELLMEKFLIKDKKYDRQSNLQMYHQPSLDPDSTDPLAEAIQRKVTRRFTRRRSSTDVQLNPEQLERELAFAQVQAEVLDTLVAEEQAEMEVEARKAFAKKKTHRSVQNLPQVEIIRTNESILEDDEEGSRIRKKVKKKKKSIDKSSRVNHDQEVFAQSIREDSDSNDEKKISEEENGLPVVQKFKVEACNSVGDFSTLWIKTSPTAIEGSTIEQFRESIRLPAPKKLSVGNLETEAEIVLSIPKPYVRDNTRNSVYLTLKKPEKGAESLDNRLNLSKLSNDTDLSIDAQSKVANIDSKDTIESSVEVKSFSDTLAVSLARKVRTKGVRKSPTANANVFSEEKGILVHKKSLNSDFENKIESDSKESDFKLKSRSRIASPATHDDVIINKTACSKESSPRIEEPTLPNFEKPKENKKISEEELVALSEKESPKEREKSDDTKPPRLSLKDQTFRKEKTPIELPTRRKFKIPKDKNLADEEKISPSTAGTKSPDLSSKDKAFSKESTPRLVSPIRAKLVSKDSSSKSHPERVSSQSNEIPTDGIKSPELSTKDLSISKENTFSLETQLKAKLDSNDSSVKSPGLSLKSVSPSKEVSKAETKSPESLASPLPSSLRKYKSYKETTPNLDTSTKLKFTFKDSVKSQVEKVTSPSTDETKDPAKEKPFLKEKKKLKLFIDTSPITPTKKVDTSSEVPADLADCDTPQNVTETSSEIDFWSEIKSMEDMDKSAKLKPDELQERTATIIKRTDPVVPVEEDISNIKITTTNGTKEELQKPEDKIETNGVKRKFSKPLEPLDLSRIRQSSDSFESPPVCLSVSQISTPLSKVSVSNAQKRISTDTLIQDEDDGLATPTNDSITKMTKWNNHDNLSNLNDLEKELRSVSTKKLISSTNSSPADSKKKMKKIVKRKKSSTKSDSNETGSVKPSKKLSNKKKSTPDSTVKTSNARSSPRDAPCRPSDLMRIFYTTPRQLMTATPRDLRKVRRAKVKKRKPPPRNASVSSDSTGSTTSTQSTTTSTEDGSNSMDEMEQKRMASTRSNDSGFDGSPRLSNCDMACHKKCEKLTGNLCGLNQKLVAEALQALKRVPSQSSENQRNSDSSDHFHTSGRITPPATNLPRFKKYAVTDFHFLKVLGKGSFGKVLLAELRGTDCVYAVKCLKKDVVLEDDDVECTLIERKVLTLATRHPYLCHLFCTFQTESHLFFVMEYLNGGDLMFHIQKSGRFSEPRSRFYAAEIWSGLNFLHKKGIVYRDLKLDNVLLDFDGHIRIADFGMCKLQIFLDRTADTFCGTPDYMAPEIIKGLKYNQAVDWWSFGILLYEMLTGQSPFSGCDEEELFWSICNERPFIPRYLSQESTSMLICLLEKDSGKRLPAHEIAVHPFFQSIPWDKLERRQLEAPFKPAVEHTLDTRYFDTAFTAERPRLTAVPEQILTSMDQSVFRGFSYTNPNATD